MTTKNKVDLTILKRLVGELENTLNTVEAMSTELNKDPVELTVEASKAVGLASGVAQEAAFLILDIQGLLQEGQAPKNKQEFLDKLLASLKIPGSN